ncbi:MAG: DUF4433 domain-containing protein [Chitinivibrionales bacterium]|nr:DUF4433 domain-containing protein [Chitinivibrionales bacterium]
MINNICVLRINTQVIDLHGSIVSDGNASSAYVRFQPSPYGLSIVQKDRTFAEDWRDEDKIQYLRNKFHKCAEVLIPGKVDPRYIFGSYTANSEAQELLLKHGFKKPIEVNKHLFFLK